MHKIFKLCGSPSEDFWQRTRLPHATSFKPQQPYKRCVAETFKDFPPSALALVDRLLAIEPEHRGSAVSALGSDVSLSSSFCLHHPYKTISLIFIILNYNTDQWKPTFWVIFFRFSSIMLSQMFFTWFLISGFSIPVFHIRAPPLWAVHFAKVSSKQGVRCQASQWGSKKVL